jgi:predicted RND superfamily exporter protein
MCGGALLVWGLTESQNLKIGDLDKGIPELRPDSRFNQDAAMITEKFSFGTDLLIAIVETIPDGCIQYDIMTAIDHLQWNVSNIHGVETVVAMPTLAKKINAAWYEGSLKWKTLPRNSQSLVQATFPISPSTGLLNHDCSVMPVYIFLKDHRAETIEHVMTKIKTLAAEEESDRVAIRLAAGFIGMTAATNDVVKAAQVPMLVWIYVAIIGLCWVTFRSWRGVVCIVLPLALVSILTVAVMSLFNIGVKVSTLPVAALGVGIGVDYSIYLFSRLNSLLRQGMNLQEAYLQALRITGKAVLVTALTLAIGVSTWAFSSLKFQADMGLLLTFKFLVNMVGALVLLPALAVLFFSPHNSKTAEENTHLLDKEINHV